MTSPALCIADFEKAAASAMSGDVWDFVQGGSGGELTLRNNREAFDAVAVMPRILSGVDSVDLATDLLHTPASMPVAVAPMAYQRLLHPDGELAAAFAAQQAGIPFVASTLSSYPVERIAAVGARTWFQLYWLRDRGVVMDLVRRAEECGCTALVVTVDVPIMGMRLRDRRNAFALPPWVTAANLTGGADSAAHQARDHTSAVAEHTRVAFDASIGWGDITWLREQTELPLVLKGVLDPRDAAQAVAAGIDALVVSNHGGRQFDGAVSSIAALPGVVDVIAGRCPTLLDSGIRSGMDVLRALALGASGVLLGRPVLWGLAVDGAKGALAVLNILGDETREALQLAGCASPSAARDLAVRLPT